MRVTGFSAWLLSVLLLAACGEEAANSDPQVESDADNAVANDAPVVAQATSRVLSDEGTGTIRAGMTLAEVELLGKTVTITQPPFDDGSSCAYAEIDGLPGLSVMLDGEKIVRFDIDPDAGDGNADAMDWQTVEGARSGTTERELRTLYGNRLTVEPHPYTGPEGHYAIVHPEDAEYGIIFETDGDKVVRWRAGLWEQVQWIEGCA